MALCSKLKMTAFKATPTVSLILVTPMDMMTNGQIVEFLKMVMQDQIVVIIVVTDLTKVIPAHHNVLFPV